ncbi:unnamed protein product [Merluccius merluccius]
MMIIITAAITIITRTTGPSAIFAPAQLFPESPALTDSESGCCSDEMIYRRERLPSIVLEPTEQCDGDGEDGGGRRWAAVGAQAGEGSGEGDNAASGEQEAGERREEMETGSSNRKSSIGPVQSVTSSSRLTPPPSPTSPDTAPPCLRS